MTRKSMFLIVSLVLIIVIFSYIILFNSSKNNYDEKASVTFIIENNENVTFDCNIADSVSEIREGLMFKSNLPIDRGMLFIFEEPKKTCFWMKNTFIPLDIIFINENKSVINIEKGLVQLNVSDDKLNSYCSDDVTKWVVEINQGLTDQYNIKKGTIVKIDL